MTAKIHTNAFAMTYDYLCKHLLHHRRITFSFDIILHYWLLKQTNLQLRVQIRMNNMGSSHKSEESRQIIDLIRSKNNPLIECCLYHRVRALRTYLSRGWRKSRRVFIVSFSFYLIQMSLLLFNSLLVSYELFKNRLVYQGTINLTYLKNVI